jgi:hypothetical protein
MVFADQTVTQNSGRLVAINPATPPQATTLEAAGTWHSAQVKGVGAFLQAAVDTGTGQYSAMRQRYSVYAKNGRLMKVDLAAGGTPTPALLSTLTTNAICYGSYIFFNMAIDYADPSKSYAIFMTPNSSGACLALGTDLRPNTAYRAVRMNMSGTDAALTIPNPLAAIRDATGAITGFIVRVGDRVQRTDANFANPVDLFESPIGMIPLGVFGTSAPGVWVYTNSSDLFAVDLANPTAPTPLGLQVNLAVTNHQAIAIDGASMYVGSGTRLFRINQDRTATQLANAPTGITEVAVTPTRVVFRTATTLSSVPKTGGTITNVVTSLGSLDLFNGVNRNGAIDPTSGSSSLWQHSFLTAGENVYTGSNNGSAPNTYGVRVVNSDGTGLQVTNGSRIVSWVESPTVPWIGNTPAHTIYVAENEGTGIFAGSPVSAYDATTRAKRFVVGNFPAFVTLSTFNDPVAPIVFGQYGVIRALTASLTGNLTFNLFLFKTDTNGLTQSTQ